MSGIDKERCGISLKRVNIIWYCLPLDGLKQYRFSTVAIKNKDWQKIAYYYNGANYRAFSYDTRLLSAYRLTGDYIKTG